MGRAGQRLAGMARLGRRCWVRMGKAKSQRIGIPVTEEQLRELSSQWLHPIDLTLADLIDKSERMTVGEFDEEVLKVISNIPQMYSELDQQVLIDELENQIGESILKGLK